MNDEGAMHINVTGTRPGKPKPGAGRKEEKLAPHHEVNALSRAQKFRALRATARTRRAAAIGEKYGIPYDSMPSDVIGFTLPGKEKFKGYRKHRGKKPSPKK
jgi:hypothetical protein